MARTQLTGQQINDGTVQRADLDATTAGNAVLKKVIAGTNITFSSTGVDAGTGDVTINATAFYDIGLFVEGTLGASETVFKFACVRSFTVPTNFAGSVVIAGNAATASAVVSIGRIPSGSTTNTQFGTLTFAAAGTIPTLSATQTSFAVGDILTVIGPSSADATLANIAITILASRP
jgi:hypothetical protein